MSVIAMRKVSIVTQEKDKEMLMTALQNAGLVHVSSLSADETQHVSTQEIHEASEKLGELSKCIKFLQLFLESPTAIPGKISQDKSLFSQVNNLRLTHEKSVEKIKKLKAEIERYSPFGDCTLKSKGELFDAGIVVKLAIVSDDELSRLNHYHVVKKIGSQNYVVLFFLHHQEIPEFVFDAPAVSVPELQKELLKEQERCKKIEEDASAFAYQIRILENYQTVLIHKYDRLIALKNVKTDQNLIGLSGFIAQKEISMLQKFLSGMVCAVVYEVPNKDHVVPVKLKNPKALKGFEAIVKEFSGVNYFEIDKTIIISLLFMFFGAFCLLDAGYGFFLLVCGYVIAIKYQRDFGQVFMWTGASSMVLGILSGQVFGLMFAKDIMLNIPPLLSLATNPMDCFKFSLLVGVLAMGVSYLVAIYQNGIRTHATGSFFAILGVITFLLNKSGILLSRYNDPSNILHLIAIACGMLCLTFWIATPENVFGNERKIANILWMFYSGPIGILQDILSHMRLFGIALSGSILALVINKIASMMPVIAGGLFAFFGHVVVFLLALLSLYIHSNRLIFLEFGQKCITGGHTYFQPFSRRINS